MTQKKCYGCSIWLDEMTLISKRGKLIVTALWDDRSSWELVKFNWEGTEINDTEVFDKLNHIQILWPAVPTLYSQFHILSWHTTLINLALWNTFWLHLASTATPVCQSIISQAPDSCPTHIIKVVEAWRSLNLRSQEAALWNTLAFFSSVWMGLLFFFFFLFLSPNQPVLFGNLCISPIKQGGAWWLLIRSSVGPEQHSWGCAGSLLERNAAETKAESQTALIRKNNTFFFLFFFLKWGTMWERGCDSAGCQYWELTTQSLPSASFQSWPQKYRITNDLVPSRQNYNTQTNFTLYIFFATSGGD